MVDIGGEKVKVECVGKLVGENCSILLVYLIVLVSREFIGEIICTTQNSSTTIRMGYKQMNSC